MPFRFLETSMVIISWSMLLSRSNFEACKLKMCDHSNESHVIEHTEQNVPFMLSIMALTLFIHLFI